MSRSKPNSSYQRSALVVLLTLSLLAVAPATAVAASLSAMSIALMYEPSRLGEPMLVVMGRVPDDVPLPAEILLPLPEQATILSAMESSLDPDSEPVPLETQVTEVDGLPAVSVTLNQSRIGIIEIGFPGSRIAQSGIDRSFRTGFDMAIPSRVDFVYAAVAIPSGVDALSADPPAQVDEDTADGRTYYYLERRDVEPGDRVALTIHVDEEWQNDPLPWLGVLIGAAILTAVIFLFVRVRAGASGRSSDRG